MSDDERTARTRRQMLGLIGGVGATVILAACGESGTTAKKASGSANTTLGKVTSTTLGSATSTTSAPVILTTIGKIPEETGGPFPGDGSNGPNILTQTGVVRSDIRSSIGTASAVAKGMPLTISLVLADTSNPGKPLAGAAVYVWHCDIDGNYSMYGNASAQNYLRGVQVADSNGVVNFTSIFPAAYSGRWPHIHFRIYPNLAAVTSGSSKLRTTQLALPESVCKEVYATDGYSGSVRSLAQTSLQSDNVFSDGSSLQVATVTGSPTAGYTAKLTVGI